MKYKFVIPMLYICSTVLLFSDGNKLSDILKQSGEKKAALIPIKEKKKSRKKSRFIFVDTYANKGIDSIEKNLGKKKSKQYDYKNKSRFKFKFSSGSDYSNVVGGQASQPSMSSGGGTHGGQGRR